MKKSYTNIQDFLDDVHNELDLKEILIDLEIIDKKDFNGNFTNCVFHDGDNTPSLQVKDSWYKCYGCGAKGDLFSFLQNYYNIDFIESVKKLSSSLNIDISSIKFRFDGKMSRLKQEWSKQQQ